MGKTWQPVPSTSIWLTLSTTGRREAILRRSPEFQSGLRVDFAITENGISIPMETDQNQQPQQQPIS